jgi:very-short-patch-repair endonuclease
MSERLDRLVAEIAVTQHRNVTHAQLRAAGLGSKAITYRAATGRLHRQYRGVYAVGAPAATPLERACAAVLACGERAALSHGSAMTLWGFWQRWDTPLEVTVTSGHPRHKGITVHRSTTLTPDDVVTHLGITVTSPGRAILDAAPLLSEPSLARTIDDALHTLFLSRSALTEQVRRNSHVPGASRIARLLSTVGGPSRSDWERAFPAFCRTHSLPRPVLNTTIAGHEVDAVWADARLIVELDSWEFHSGRLAFENDRDRDADTLLAGFATVRITWERMHGAADAEAKRLNAILAARRADKPAL